MLKIYFKEQIRKARQVNLVTFLHGQGYSLKKEPKGNYRLPEHGGLIVRGNHWWHASSNQGGNTLDFLIKFLGYSFNEAMKILTSQSTIVLEAPAEVVTVKKDFTPPKKARNERRVIAYLTQKRGLPAELVVLLIRAGLLYQDERGNCVFPCFDEGMNMKSAILNGTTDKRWKGMAPGSDTSHGWLWPPTGSSDTVVVCENPIDAMSLSILHPGCRKYYILALGGLHLEALEGLLRTVEIKKVVIAVDDDKAAGMAMRRLLEVVGSRQVVGMVPKMKDWNDDLLLKKGVLKCYKK